MADKGDRRHGIAQRFREEIGWIASALFVLVTVVSVLTGVFGLLDDDEKDPTQRAVANRDRDGDRVPDRRDKCPDVRAVRDADRDGCEDPVRPQPVSDDRDGDGIEDKLDRCPDEKPERDDDGDGCPDAEGGYDGLWKLIDNGDVKDADPGQRVELVGEDFDDAVETFVHVQDPDASRLSIRVGARYQKMTGLVGIDNDGECEDNTAEVSIIDPESNVLWGPKTATFDSRHKITADISRLNRVILVQRPLQGEKARCEYGLAEVGWGRVRFHPAKLDLAP